MARTKAGSPDGSKKTGTKDPGTKKTGRLAQIRSTYRMAKKSDPRLGWLLLAVFLGVVAVFVALGLLLDSWVWWLAVGLPLALLVTTVIFGRRAERAAYSQIEGQPGAAASALGTLRKGWFTQTAVAVNRNSDLVHRVVGRAGIVLVGEGQPGRVRNLLAQERKRHARVAPDAPIHEVVVGDAEGQVPLRKLANHIMKLPRGLQPAQVTEVQQRLRALGTSPVPIPKGPLPRGARVPRSGLNR